MPKKMGKGLLSKTESKKEFAVHTKVNYMSCMDLVLEGDKLKPSEMNELCCQGKYEVVSNFDAMTEKDKDEHLYSLFICIQGHKSDEYMRKWLEFLTIVHRTVNTPSCDHDNLLTKCDIHLAYVGNGLFAELRLI